MCAFALDAESKTNISKQYNSSTNHQYSVVGIFLRFLRRKETEMRLKPVVKASEFLRFGFKPCRGLPKSAESYYLCVKNGHRVMFVDSKHFTETEWPIKDARIHKNPNCKFSDKRTATEIECELVVNGLLEEVRE